MKCRSFPSWREDPSDRCSDRRTERSHCPDGAAHPESGAIRCYGHHQSGFANSQEINSPNMNMAGKVLDAVGKVLNQQ